MENKSKLKFYIEYYGYAPLINKSLNSKNINAFDKKKLNHLAKKYPSDIFEEYKKRLFFSIYNHDLVYDRMSSNKYKKLLKLLDIKFTATEINKINDLKVRVFTSERAIKTIDIPDGLYTNLNKLNVKNKKAYFIYRSVRVGILNNDGKYSNSSITYDLYLLKEAVAISTDNPNINTMNKIIFIKDIDTISFSLKKGIDLSFVNSKRRLCISSEDNLVLFVSFKRLYRKLKQTNKTNLIKKYPEEYLIDSWTY